MSAITPSATPHKDKSPTTFSVRVSAALAVLAMCGVLAPWAHAVGYGTAWHAYDAYRAIWAHRREYTDGHGWAHTERHGSAPSGGVPHTVAAQGSIEVAFSPNGGGERMIARAIEQARSQILVAAYSFTARPIAMALIAAEQRGVHVFVVLDAKENSDNGRYAKGAELARAGVPIRLDSRYAIMHNKFMVIGQTTVITGSYNYTYSAAHRNAENVLVLRGNAQLASLYAHSWERYWTDSKPIDTATRSQP